MNDKLRVDNNIFAYCAIRRGKKNKVENPDSFIHLALYFLYRGRDLSRTICDVTGRRAAASKVFDLKFRVRALLQNFVTTCVTREFKSRTFFFFFQAITFQWISHRFRFILEIARRQRRRSFFLFYSCLPVG